MDKLKEGKNYFDRILQIQADNKIKSITEIINSIANIDYLEGNMEKSLDKMDQYMSSYAGELRSTKHNQRFVMINIISNILFLTDLFLLIGQYIF
jgi:hypothetical protein